MAMPIVVPYTPIGRRIEYSTANGSASNSIASFFSNTPVGAVCLTVTLILVFFPLLCAMFFLFLDAFQTFFKKKINAETMAKLNKMEDLCMNLSVSILSVAVFFLALSMVFLVLGV